MQGVKMKTEDKKDSKNGREKEEGSKSKSVLSDYVPPRIVEKRKIEVELFSDEPDPWGPC